MLPPDMMAALQGGGGAPAGPPPPGAGGLPPDIMAALSGGGATPQGAPADGGQPLDLVEQVIELVKQIIDAEPEPEDQATWSNVLNTIMQYQAKDQKEQDAMLGGKVSPKGLRKAMAGAEAGY